MTENEYLKLVDVKDQDMSYRIIGLWDNRFLCSGKSLNQKAAVLILQHK